MWVSLKRTACRSNPALRLASGWSSRAATACATALKWRFPIARPAPRPARAARRRGKARASGGAKRGHEPVAPLHPAAGGDISADGRDPARRAIAYRLLPLSALPEVGYPTIQVVTFYPGVSLARRVSGRGAAGRDATLLRD